MMMDATVSGVAPASNTIVFGSVADDGAFVLPWRPWETLRQMADKADIPPGRFVVPMAALPLLEGLLVDPHLNQCGMESNHDRVVGEAAAEEGLGDDAMATLARLAAGVVHRVGKLQPGDQIVWVGVSSAHREAAFSACEFIMDYLKTRAPFWKRECGTEGARWVDARDSDEGRAERWQ